MRIVKQYGTSAVTLVGVSTLGGIVVAYSTQRQQSKVALDAGATAKAYSSGYGKPVKAGATVTESDSARFSDLDSQGVGAALSLLRSEYLLAVYPDGTKRRVSATVGSTILENGKQSLFAVEFTLSDELPLEYRRRLLVNGVEVELPDNEPVAVTKQCSNLGEIQDRQADYSTDFKIPATRENIRALGLPNVVGSVASLAYLIPVATYIEGGRQKTGTLYINSFDGQNFTAVLYGSLVGFFDTLGSAKLSELSGLLYSHPLDDGAFAYGATDTDAVRFAVFEPTDKGDGWATENLSLLNFRPFVSFKAILQSIAAKVGWQFEAIPTSINEYLLCNTLQPIRTPWRVALACYAPLTDALGGFTLSNSSVLADAKSQLSADGGGNRLVTFDRIGKHKISLKGQYITHGATSFSLLDVVGTGSSLDIYTIAINTTDGVIQDFDVVYQWEATADNISKPHGFKYQAEGAGATVTVTGLSMNIVLDSAEIAYDDSLDIPAMLPDMSCSDFFKGVLQKHGLAVTTDPASLTLRLWGLSEVAANVGRAYDFTEYVDMGSGPTIAYKVGSYESINALRYTYGDDVAEGTNDYLMGTPYGTGSTKELLKLPFTASGDMLLKGNRVARIPIAEKQSDGGYTNSDGKGNRVAALLPSNNEAIKYRWRNWPSVGYIEVTSYARAAFGDGLNPQGLEATGPRDYGVLASLLADFPQTITVKMLLPITLEEGFDYTRPVYLGQYGRYFYVNKITGWGDGSLATVELIKLY